MKLCVIFVLMWLEIWINVNYGKVWTMMCLHLQTCFVYHQITKKTIMKGVWFLGLSICLWFIFANAVEERRQIYVVYMGAIPDDSNAYSLKETHYQLLTSVLKRGHYAEKTIVHRYEHGFSGFAARLTKEEAAEINKRSDVVSVFVDPVYQLHTTRSWEFLQESFVETSLKQEFSSRSLASGTSDTIIGLLDTGIWPESKSFDDSGIGAIPSRWKGTCVKASDFNSSNCNKKLIGARFYNTDDDDDSRSTSLTDEGTPRDSRGHGTHTSSTAAGSIILDASYYGLAPGTAKGGSPGSRIAMYKVCGQFGCPGSALLAAFDDAISDGVDLLSISLGGSATTDFSVDPIAIGSFHAVSKGITVVCSAGNAGPDQQTVVNAAPWILTVAATTIDRTFESDIVLGGNNMAVKGEGINFSNLSKTADYPLVGGGSVKSNSSSEKDSSHCELGDLDPSKIKGKIILCKHSIDDSSKSIKAYFMQRDGAIGAIIADETVTSDFDAYIDFPVTIISPKEANSLSAYINSTKNPTATILASVTVEKYKPAPAVASFSSRGPCSQTGNILKPDIAAPGVNILASWIPTNGSSEVPSGQKPSSFNLDSGTSMACPHVAGVAATVKSWNPTWSPSAIRSAIMTTATQTNNDKVLTTTDTGSVATPYDYGAGEVSPGAALQPGLVYEVQTEDYLQFLCNYGYNVSTIKLIATVPEKFECSKNSSVDLISDLNYPSISISKFDGKERTVSRVVTNVGAEEETSYVAVVKSPDGLEVKINPEKLWFTKNVKSLSYQATFSSSSSLSKGSLFGSITWSDGVHKVRSPFAVQAT